MPLEGGDTFAGYVVQRLLGSGGMGEVYLARHPRLPRPEALKVLSLDATADEEFRARFTREAELAATLWHPHIVGVHDRGEFNGRLWISMDYVDGTDAGQLLAQRHPAGMPVQDVVEILDAVAEALDFAHERRLLHRDVKPANILVTTPSGGARRRVLLTDFGIARETDDNDGLTEVGMAIGTVNYAAPEQLVSKSLDGRVDQYALAATAFHLLTGAPLFENSNRAVVVGNHLTTPPPRLSERRPALAPLDAVMAKALSKDPADRYPTCSEFAAALADAAGLGRVPSASTNSRDLEAVVPDASAPPPLDPGMHTAPFDVAGERRPSAPHTKRLESMAVFGTARAVQKGAPDPGSGDEVWSFRVERYDSTSQAHSVVPVELRGTSITGQLSDGDAVEVEGFWDDGILRAESVVNRSGGSGGGRKSTDVGARAGDAARGRIPKARKTRIVVVGALGALVAILATTVFVTRGFGLWSDRGPGPIVEPENATVFSPGSSPDHPAEAGLAIDGDPNTAWSTDTYLDGVPFPTFKQGVGLILHLSQPTALSEVSIDVASTGTEVQIRAADSANPANLSDTTELTTDVVLQRGANHISVDNQTKTANVLVWINKLGTTDGKSRTEISNITLQAAR